MGNKNERKEAKYFAVKRLENDCRFLLFHEYVNICYVMKGDVVFMISGEKRKLSVGQIAIVDAFENYSIESRGESEVLTLSVGINYLRCFFAVYPNGKLPRWLMDAQYNEQLYNCIEKFDTEPQTRASELKRIGMVCGLLSDVIEHYGLEKTTQDPADDIEMTARIVKYIHAHYSEKITLETLSREFHVSPSVLSKKIRKRLGVDLRVFVNDIRVQKVVQMMNDPKHHDKNTYDLAMMCGFSSMSTFYRCYNRTFGTENRSETDPEQD